MTNYFTNCKNETELKATYKELVKTYHPDIYGEKGNDILKEIHNQLEKALKNIDKKAYNDLYNGNDREESDEIRAKKEELTQAAQNVAVKAYQQAQQQQNANNGNKNANDDGTIDADYEDVK